MFENLEGILTWVLGGGGAGWLAYWLIEQLNTGKWDPFWKRVFSLTVTGLFGVLAYGVAVMFGYRPGCSDWQSWVEQIVAVIALAITTSQTIHGALKLERRSDGARF